MFQMKLVNTIAYWDPNNASGLSLYFAYYYHVNLLLMSMFNHAAMCFTGW